MPTAPQAAAAAAPAAAEPLRAVFIDVGGKVQWRANENDAWHDAHENDVVGAGVEVRTAMRSHAALRVGRNATVLIDAGTLFQLPEAVQDGETLRTTATVKHGRADFKVDKVGLSNDFKVVTPSTTLSVRGTYFAVASGPLKQVEVVGARTNAINAIELKYSLNNATVQLSGGATSSSGLQEPAHAAVVAASAPASAAVSGSTSQHEVIQSAASGPPPSQAGSPAQAHAANKSGATAAKASGQAGGANAVESRIQQSVDSANVAVKQAIEYLLVQADEEQTLEGRRDALVALKDLATAKRDAAREALAVHESVLASARAEERRAGEQAAGFDQRYSSAKGQFQIGRAHV